MLTSPSETLGCPKRPKTKNGTEAPSIGSCSDRLVLDVPVAVLRNVITPPVALDLPVRVTSTSGVLAPEGSVNRIRQGDAAHVRYRARGLALLLICKSTVTRGISFAKIELSQQATSDEDCLAREDRSSWAMISQYFIRLVVPLW
jgi:hypothetical protein